MATIETRRPDVADDSGRRDFLLYGTGAVAVVGTALALWPFIDSMNPAADILALSSAELDLAPIAVGQRVTVTWRGKPVFVSHRTKEEIQIAVAADDDPKLIDPATDASRVQMRTGSSSSGSARTWAACRSGRSRATRAAATAAGSARAMARNTTPRAASATAPRPGIWPCRPTPSRPTRPRSSGDRQATRPALARQAVPDTARRRPA